jgi:tetratricopeptide (TPR) repeat protein
MANKMFPRKHTLALSVLLGLSSQAVMAQDSASRALLEQGLFWQAKGNNERAAEAWGKLSQLDPSEPRALYGLAQVEINLKRSATDLLARLRALDPNSRYAAQLEQDINLRTGDGPKALEKARLLFESKEIEPAIEQYRAVFQGKEPQGDVGVEFYRVVGQSETGWKEARRGLERLLRASPKDPQIEMHLAFMLARGEAPRRETRVEGVERLSQVALNPLVSGFATESWKVSLGWLDVTKPEMLALFDKYLKLHPDDSEVRELRAAAVKKLQAQAKANEPTPVNPLIAAGLKALEQGDLVLAENQYQARLKVSPNDMDALGGLGLVRLKQDRLDDSQALLMRASQQKNGSGWSKALLTVRYLNLVEQGTTAQREGDVARARTLLQQAIKLDPTQSAGELALAALQTEAGEFDAAAKTYRQLLARQSGDADALRGLALVLATAEKPDEALKLIEQLTPAQLGGVSQMNQLRAALVTGKAKAALRRGDVALAMSTLEEAMSVDRDNPWIRWELALLYQQQGRASEARGLIDGLLASQPDNPVALYASANFAAARGQFRAALAALERIERKDRTPPIAALQKRSWLQYQAAQAIGLARQNRQPEALALLAQAEPWTDGNRDLVGLLAGAYVDAGATNQGLAILRQNMARNEQVVPADALQYAGLLLRTGQDVESAGVLKKLTAGRLNPDDAKGLGELMFLLNLRQVDLLRERGELVAANDKLQPLLTQRPDDVLAKAALARWLAASGDKPGALALARQLAMQYPGQVQVQLGAAQIAVQLKDADLAAKALQVATTLAPENSEVMATAARLFKAQGKSKQAEAFFERAIALQNVAANGIDASATVTLAAADSSDPLSDVGGPAWLQPSNLQAAPASPGEYWQQALPKLPAQRASPATFAAAGDAANEPAKPNLNAELNDLRQTRSPEVLLGTQMRQRSGSAGTSQLKITELPLELRLPVGDGRLKLQVTPVSLDAGAGVKARGVASAIGYKSGGLAVDAGITPAGFQFKSITGGVKLDGSLDEAGSLSYQVDVSSRPVTDSVLSFAGQRDSSTGKTWGGVMASGARVQLAKDMGGYGGVAILGKQRLAGHEVESNGRTEFGLGGYVDVSRRPEFQLSSGLNFSHLAYQKNQNDFSFGQGGYFSPQQYNAVTVPLNWAQRSGRISYLLQSAVGFQKYKQDASTAGGSPFSSSGVAYKLAASAQIQLAPHWLLDAVLQSDNSGSGSYHQYRAGLNLRYSFAPITQPLALSVSPYTTPFGQ